jgi:hypothetical protein
MRLLSKVLTKMITPIYCLDKMILIYISPKIIPSLIHAIHISRHPIYSTATILYLCIAVALLTPSTIHALTFIHMDFVALIMAARAYINYDVMLMQQDVPIPMTNTRCGLLRVW